MAVERYAELINVDELQGHADRRMEAVVGLTRLIELLEVARQDPDYVECVGDAELFKTLTWAAAQLASPGDDAGRPPRARTTKRRAA